MTKQMGRNASFCRAAMRGGIDKAVAVDMECARADASGGHGARPYRPSRAGSARRSRRRRGDEAGPLDGVQRGEGGRGRRRHKQRGQTQGLLARIVAEGDRFYRGHEGGFAAADIVAVADRLDALDGARFAGVTTFPRFAVR